MNQSAPADVATSCRHGYGFDEQGHLFAYDIPNTPDRNSCQLKQLSSAEPLELCGKVMHFDPADQTVTLVDEACGITGSRLYVGPGRLLTFLAGSPVVIPVPPGAVSVAIAA